MDGDDLRLRTCGRCEDDEGCRKSDCTGVAHGSRSSIGEDDFGGHGDDVDMMLPLLSPTDAHSEGTPDETRLAPQMQQSHRYQLANADGDCRCGCAAELAELSMMNQMRCG